MSDHKEGSSQTGTEEGKEQGGQLDTVVQIEGQVLQALWIKIFKYFGKTLQKIFTLCNHMSHLFHYSYPVFGYLNVEKPTSPGTPPCEPCLTMDLEKLRAKREVRPNMMIIFLQWFGLFQVK